MVTPVCDSSLSLKNKKLQTWLKFVPKRLETGFYRGLKLESEQRHQHGALLQHDSSTTTSLLQPAGPACPHKNLLMWACDYFAWRVRDVREESGLLPPPILWRFHKTHKYGWTAVKPDTLYCESRLHHLFLTPSSLDLFDYYPLPPSDPSFLMPFSAVRFIKQLKRC